MTDKINYGAQDISEQNARVDHLELLYMKDGRHDEHHSQHGLYVGLVAKFGKHDD